jgi:DNA-binding NarL/FixJ family response regulator
MNRSLHLKANKTAAVLVIDPLELRRAGVVSFLRPWADDGNIDILQINPAEALERRGDIPIRMILLVIGAQCVAESDPQNWIAGLHGKYADSPLVLMSEREEPEEVVAAFRAGARGFIPMSVTPPVAMQAFTFIMSGGSFFPPTALIQRANVTGSVRLVTKRTTTIAAADVHGLTARQLEVLERLRQGESNKLIGRQLKLRESTVKVHIRQIMRKLGATNRTQAALCAAQLSLGPRDGNESEDEADDSVGQVTRARAVFVTSRAGVPNANCDAHSQLPPIGTSHSSRKGAVRADDRP